MKIPYKRIHAFTTSLHGGNPAGLCLCEQALCDEHMQGIAAENNLSETAFLMPKEKGWHIRWFTPSCEVDLCGHATLAAAAALHEWGCKGDEWHFSSASGPLSVRRIGRQFELNFPADTPSPIAADDDLAHALGITIHSLHRGRFDLLAICDADSLRACIPNMAGLMQLPRGIILSAFEDGCMLSRFFAPAAGIDEDPVTGSAHCTLTPYWCTQEKVNSLPARQLSQRGGQLHCRLEKDRVLIAGEALTYQDGFIYVD